MADRIVRMYIFPDDRVEAFWESEFTTKAGLVEGQLAELGDYILSYDLLNTSIYRIDSTGRYHPLNDLSDLRERIMEARARA